MCRDWIRELSLPAGDAACRLNLGTALEKNKQFPTNITNSDSTGKKKIDWAMNFKVKGWVTRLQYSKDAIITAQPFERAVGWQ
jgi:hypothetical protein